MSTIAYGLGSSGGGSLIMRRIYQVLTLAPAPVFLAGAVYSVFHTPSMCGAFPYEMALMWFIMFLAHLSPWLLFYQQHFARNA